MKVFLSHSSFDKDFVRRLHKDLKTHSVSCWIDEEDIPFGGSIPKEISRGLDESDVLLLILSRRSVLSKWVESEWQSKFFSQVNEEKIIVIPVVIEECNIPTILSDKRYVDFSNEDDYEHNFSLLLRQLQQQKLSNSQRGHLEKRVLSVYEYTTEILEELEEEVIALPVHKRLPIIETLAKIPRSGKHIRLHNKVRPTLKIRSIYDHILSVSHVADSIIPFVDHGLQQDEFAELARVIAFHELNEVILGDIPTYTNLNRTRRNSVRIYAEERLRSVPPDKRERIANDLIWMFLSEKQRQSMEEVNGHLADKSSQVFVFFKVLDKLDPIICTWRYLHEYRGKLQSGAKIYLRQMKDFFENPDVKAFIKQHKVDSSIYDMAAHLQNRTNAWHYYEKPDYFNQKNLIGIPSSGVKRAIEGIRLAGLHKKFDMS